MVADTDFTYDRLRREHHQIRSSLGQLDVFLENPRPDPGDADARQWAAYLVESLSKLYEKLQRHFNEEEASGLLVRLGQAHPRRLHSIEALLSEHPVILEELGSLVESLKRYAEGDAVEDPRLRTRVRETILRLKAHEASETELVQSIVTRDLGGGD